MPCPRCLALLSLSLVMLTFTPTSTSRTEPGAGGVMGGYLLGDERPEPRGGEGMSNYHMVDDGAARGFSQEAASNQRS